MGKKEPARNKRREVHKEGEEVHEAALKKWEEVAAWSICNDRWRNFQRITKASNASSIFIILQKLSIF